MNKLPILLDHPRAWRSYLGGALLDELLGDDTQSGADGGHFPEEWIISTVQAANPGREHLAEGLAHIAQGLHETDGRPQAAPAASNAPTLKALIKTDPTALLGEAHVAALGAQLGVLVKLIDSAERLTIQVHPDKQKARELFHSAYGKTECWHILGTKEIDGQTPCVYFGFKEGITRARWEELFFSQDIPAMLDCLHCCPVTVGDTIFIEGGVPHAIGAGCFLVEIQEPTDYTLRTERTTPSGFAVADALCHQGLGFEKMFDNFHYEGYTEAEVRAKWFLPSEILQSQGDNVERLLVGGDAAEAFFSMKEYLVANALSLKGSSGFSGLYVLEGAGEFATAEGSIALQAPAQYFIPANSPDFTLTNTSDSPLRVLQFWGPAV